MPALKPSSAVSSPLVPRVKVWLEVDGDYVFGWGICEILSSVAEHGSIKDAAAALGKSYRYVWGRVKEAEQALDTPLVECRVGGHADGRSELSELARALVSDFREFRERVTSVASQEFNGRFAELHRLAKPAGKRRSK